MCLATRTAAPDEKLSVAGSVPERLSLGVGSREIEAHYARVGSAAVATPVTFDSPS